MKKAISITGILTIILFLYHAIICTCLYGGVMKYSSVFKASGGFVFLIILVHFLCNFIELIKRTIRKKNVKNYTKLNKDNYLQNYSGYLIAIFVVIHIILMECFMLFKTSIFYITVLTTQIIFTFLLFQHIYLSIPRLFISLGIISKESTYEVVKKATLVISIVLAVCIMGIQFIYYIRLI